MIKYICNVCKREIHPNELSTIKTQTGEKTTVAHLCPRCLRAVRRICKENLRLLVDVDDTGSNTSVKTGDAIEDKPNFKLNIESFVEGMPTSKPRLGGTINVQRILLCMYKGETLTDIAAELKVPYQTVFQCKRKYTSRIIAARHLEPQRVQVDIRMIIDSFIKHGDVVITAAETGVSEERIKEILTHYTGYSW